MFKPPDLNIQNAYPVTSVKDRSGTSRVAEAEEKRSKVTLALVSFSQPSRMENAQVSCTQRQDAWVSSAELVTCDLTKEQCEVRTLNQGGKKRVEISHFFYLPRLLFFLLAMQKKASVFSAF